MKLKNIPDEVVDALRESGHTDETIESMDGKELFYEYCQYEGLINYGHKLWDIVHKLSTKKNKK